MNTDPVQALKAMTTRPAPGEGTASMRAVPAAASPPPDAAAPAATDATSVAGTSETPEAIAAELQEYLRNIGVAVQFSIDSDSGETIISVRDAANGELIRQIPSEEALRLREALKAHRGALLDVLA